MVAHAQQHHDDEVHMIRKFLNLLEENGVEYVVWKSIEDAELLDQDCSLELDLYIPEQHAEKLCELARDYGFSHRATTLERYTDFLYIVESRRIVMLHVQYRIITGARHKNFHLDIGDELLRSRVRKGGVWVSDPKPVLVYHCLKYVLLGIDKHWNGIVASTEEQRSYANAKLKEKFGPGVITAEALLASDRDPATRKAIRAKVVAATRFEYWRLTIRHTIDRIGTRLRWIFGRRGFTVAFVGVDGSGKSTLSQNLSDKLECLGSKATFYLGPNKTYPRPLRLAIRLTTLAKALIKSRIGVVGVYDRYLYDMLTYREMPDGVTNLLYKVMPTPDFTFFCDAPVDVIVARKAYDEPDELRAVTEQFRKLLRERPNTFFLDTTQDSDETAAQVMDILQPRIERSLI